MLLVADLFSDPKTSSFIWSIFAFKNCTQLSESAINISSNNLKQKSIINLKDSIVIKILKYHLYFIDFTYNISFVLYGYPSP